MSKPQFTVLHIDDNEANRYVVGRILHNGGFRVEEAATGEAGLQAALAHQPDLIILDVKLPGMSGFEVCQQIKANPQTAFVPVLHLSASFVESQDKAQGLDSGADAYLTQPVSPIELLATVRSLLRIRQAEESALRLAREWQKTFDSITDGVGLLDRDGKFLRCNKALLQVFDKPLDQVLERPYQEVMKQTIGVGDGFCFRLAKETLQREGYEFQAGDRWFSKTVDPVLDEQGSFTGAVYILSNITDRKWAEAALESSEERLELASRAAQFGTFEWNIQADKIYWSEQEEALYGLPPGGFAGKYENWKQTLHPDDLVQTEQAVQRSAREGTDLDAEFRIVRPDQTVRWIAAKARVYHDHQGKPLRMIGVNEDITDRKQAEATLQERNQRLDLLYETTRDLLSSEQPLALIDGLFQKLKGPLELDVYFNYLVDADRHQLRLVTYGGIPESIAQQIEWLDYGETICGAVAEQGCQIIQCDVQRSLGPKTELIRSLGINAYSCQPLIAQGHLFGILSFGSRRRQQFTPAETDLLQSLCDQMAIALERFRLVDSLQQQAQQLRQANQIKDEFLAVLSHELRSPLNPILGWTRLLRTRTFDAAATDRALETIERNAKLQTQLIGDLLDVSRILQGKMALTVSSVDLVSTIESAIETVRFAAEAKNIRLQTQFADDVGPVMGDPARLQQVVWNLLSNAVKFTAEQGQVAILLEQVEVSDPHQTQQTQQNSKAAPQTQSAPQSSYKPKHYAQITIADTGKGINPDFLPHVFEYFRQEDGKTTRKFGGLGLGLAIVRYLTEAHGGTVEANSLGEGQGATFTVRLPLLNQQLDQQDTEEQISKETLDRLQPKSPHQTVLPPLSSLKVLVVDDEPDMRELLIMVLEQAGAMVKVAESAWEALMLLEQFVPDVLVSDIGMPNMDGYMLMRQVRARLPEQGGKIPAIALTAYAHLEAEAQALAEGFHLHLAKPIEPDSLTAAIVRLTQKPIA